MDRKIIKNYIYNVLFQLVKIVLPFFLVPYTMGHLGESVLGISDFAGNIASWFILFGVLGINVYGNREIAKVRDDKDELSTMFFEILLVQVVNMIIALALYSLYVWLIVKDNQLIYWLYVLTVVSSAFDISWFYYGIENFKIVSIRNTVVKAVGVLLIFLLVKNPSDLWLYVVINSGSDFIGQIITYLGLKDYINYKRISLKIAYKRHLKATFLLFVPTIAINVYTLLDQTMLGVLIKDKGDVALYKAAQGFVKMFLYFITSIGSVVMPRIANVFYKGNKDEVNRYIGSTLRFAIVLGLPMMVAMICVSPYFFPWYLPNQPSMIKLVQYSSPIILFIAISNVFGTQYLVPTDRTKEYTISVVFGAVVNFIINFILIPRLGAVGAVIGSVIAEFTVTLVQYVYVRKEIKVNVLNTTIKTIAGIIVMGIVVIFVGNRMSVSIVTNIIQAIVGAIVYGIVMLILKEETIMNVFNKFVRKQ